MVTSGRGSRFILCERSRIDSRYPRYPMLPVLRCAGFDPMDEPDSDGASRRSA
jgi:hypothetical protein